jgi:hypothetical protein
MSFLAETQAPRARQARRERRRRRRALAAQDWLSAKLAELFRIDALLEEATLVVERGWTQHAWFTYVDGTGSQFAVKVCTPRVARKLATQQVTSACLVGAVVTAGGGPAEARGQLVQRTLDLIWHTSFRGGDEPIRWDPSSAERLCHAIDLVRWNDRPDRTPDEVVTLLDRARGVTCVEVARTRAQQREIALLLDE